MNNQRTVTIKMTRGEALKLCSIINSYVFSLEHDELKPIRHESVDNWRNIHDKVRAGVDKLDASEVE